MEQEPSDTTKKLISSAVSINTSQTSTHMRILQLRESCEFSVRQLSKTKKKIKRMKIAFTESVRLKDEYICRCRRSLCNKESLIQAKNELEKSRCGFKAEYLMECLKSSMKQEHFKNQLSYFQNKWKLLEENYGRIEDVKKLRDIEKKILEQENKMKELEELILHVKLNYTSLKDNLSTELRSSIVEFAKCYLKIKETEALAQQKREKTMYLKSLQDEIQSLSKARDKGFIVFAASNETAECNIPFFTKAVNFSDFDNPCIPEEHLESVDDIFEVDNEILSQEVFVSDSSDGCASSLQSTQDSCFETENQTQTQSQTQSQSQFQFQSQSQSQSQSQTQFQSQSQSQTQSQSQSQTQLESQVQTQDSEFVPSESSSVCSKRAGSPEESGNEPKKIRYGEEDENRDYESAMEEKFDNFNEDSLISEMSNAEGDHENYFMEASEANNQYPQTNMDVADENIKEAPVPHQDTSSSSLSFLTRKDPGKQREDNTESFSFSFASGTEKKSSIFNLF